MLVAEWRGTTLPYHKETNVTKDKKIQWEEVGRHKIVQASE